GALIDFDLHREHPLATALQSRQDSLLLFLSELLEPLLQFLLGFFEFGDHVVDLRRSILGLIFLEVVFDLFLNVVGVLNLLLARHVGRRRVLAVGRRLAVVGLLVLVGLALGLLLRAGLRRLALARLALAVAGLGVGLVFRLGLAVAGLLLVLGLLIL